MTRRFFTATTNAYRLRYNCLSVAQLIHAMCDVFFILNHYISSTSVPAGWPCLFYARHQQSATDQPTTLRTPRTRTVTYGPRSFAVSGPTVWNTLPSTLRVSTTTLGQFQSGLKTMLFRLAYGT